MLPDGRKFTGPDELRAILIGDREAFARALTSKLLTYALGRGLERYDSEDGQADRQPAAALQLPVLGLVLEIVNSLPFQSRRRAAARGTSEAEVAERERAAVSPPRAVDRPGQRRARRGSLQ